MEADGARGLEPVSERADRHIYKVQPTGNLRVNDLVVAMPPEPVATFLADGGYLARGVPLIKRVLALAVR